MSQRARDANERSRGPRPWLAAEVEGRTVGFWLVVAVAIAAVVLACGAWRVWGL